MAREIDVSDPSKLTMEERLYLQDRDRLPEGVEPVSMEDRMSGNETELVAHATGTVLVPKDKVDEYTGRADQAADEADMDDEELEDYNELSVDELKAEAKARKLQTTGTKADLVARLEADDAKADGA